MDALPELRGVLCPVCGYDLSAAIELRCAECGYKPEQLDYAGEEHRRLYLQFTRSLGWISMGLVLVLTAAVATPALIIVAPSFIITIVLYRPLPRQHRSIARRVWMTSILWLHLPWLILATVFAVWWWLEQNFYLAGPDHWFGELEVGVTLLTCACLGAWLWWRSYFRSLSHAGLSSGFVGRRCIRWPIVIASLVTCLPMVAFGMSMIIATILDRFFPRWDTGW